jgi:uncharacterized protein YggE
MRIVQIGVVAVVVALAVAFAGVGRPDSARGSSPQSRSITVSGTANVDAVPNRAALVVGVSTDAATARAALAGNAEKAASVLDALRAAGVARADLQTADVSVSPRWGDNGKQDGFTAHTSVQVKVREVGKAGALLDAAVAAGATETSGPSFDRADRAQLYRDALKTAFADARLKAATLAGEAGASLGNVLRIEESPAYSGPQPLYGGAADMARAPTPVEPGTQQVQATISVTFGLA